METNNKLREALEYISSILKGFNFDNQNAPTPDDLNCVHGAISIAEAALAEPVRNCEVGTADEQLKRFKDFCRIISKDETCDGCPLLPQCSTLEHCTLKWAQMPYEEGGNDGK